MGYIPSPEQPSKEYPFILITGRSLYHFNMGSMTRRTQNVVIFPEDILGMSPEDSESLGIRDGDYVVVESRYGSARVRVKVTDRVRRGFLFSTIHFPETSINRVTGPHYDRISHIPEYKVTAVRVLREDQVTSR